MTLEVLFLGLQSPGLALAKGLRERGAEVRMKGFDLDKAAGQAAQAAGAIERTVHNPFKAAEQADLIVMTLPATAAHDYLIDLAPRLKEGAILLDGSMLQSSSLRWARENLPENRSYVGFLPVVSYEGLLGDQNDGSAVGPDQYEGGLFAYVITPDTPERAVNILINLAEAVGASPFFVDPSEMDSIASIVDVLPAVTGLSLLLLAADSRAWNDIMRLSGKPFAEATRYSAEHDVELLRRKLLDNRVSLVAYLERFQDVLSGLSQLLQEEDAPGLEELVSAALQARSTWLANRKKADWQAVELGEQTVGSTGLLGNLFGFDRSRRPGRD